MFSYWLLNVVCHEVSIVVCDRTGLPPTVSCAQNRQGLRYGRVRRNKQEEQQERQLPPPPHYGRISHPNLGREAFVSFGFSRSSKSVVP